MRSRENCTLVLIALDDGTHQFHAAPTVDLMVPTLTPHSQLWGLGPFIDLALVILKEWLAEHLAAIITPHDAAMPRHCDDKLRPVVLRYAHPCFLINKPDEPAPMMLAGEGDCG
jgi:hypothetical protein